VESSPICHPSIDSRCAFSSTGLGLVRPYDFPVTVADFLAHSLPLVLIAAVSPVLFLNASRVVEAAGISAGLYFAGGAVLCLVALGIPTMGLMGAATSQVVAADLASRGVDLTLALVLIAYGAWQVARSRRARTATGASGTTTGASRTHKDDALPTGGRALFAAGLLGMLTNFTTLPLYLSVAQRTGTVAAPWWGRALLLAVVVVVVAAPVWLPIGLRAVAPGHAQIRPEVRRRIQTATQRISIGACFVGGALIIWHVLKG
jgi:Sap, sulfolipid-1-addressing protein